MAPSAQNFDVTAEAEKLRREHGPEALDHAFSTAQRHLQTAEWRWGARWLQVVNHLRTTAEAASTFNQHA